MNKQQRDKDGKFARKKLANPDCEPASKGLVKCWMRKMADDTGNAASGALVKTAVFWEIVFGVSICINIVFPEIEWMYAATIIAFILFIQNFVTAYMAFTDVSDLEYLQKYQPPVCKEKEECEE